LNICREEKAGQKIIGSERVKNQSDHEMTDQRYSLNKVMISWFSRGFEDPIKLFDLIYLHSIVGRPGHLAKLGLTKVIEK
jgi:hypothetical protein